MPETPLSGRCRRRLWAAALLIATVAPVLVPETGAPAQARPTAKEMMVWRRKVLIDMQNRARALLAQQMLECEAWLKRYCQKHGHLPPGGDELAYAQARLLSACPVNPYHPLTTPESGMEQRYEARLPDSVVVYGLYGMTGDYAADVVEKAPESWESEPGTITVYSNGRNLAVIWGADSDHRPLRDPHTNKPVVSIVRCEENQGL